MKTKIFSLLLLLSLLLSLFASCQGQGGGVGETLPGESERESAESAASTEPTPSSPLRVGTLKGPTGMGMAKLIKDSEASGANTVSLFSSPDEITSAVISGQLDVAAVPVNLAAVLHQKTNGDFLVAAVNTLGVLYILENGDTVHSVADLAGKTLYATGQGSTPEYILNEILAKNGLTGVKVEYKTEHSELAALMASGEVVLGMLPEPNVTSVLMKNSSVRIALNLTEEWKKVCKGEAVQGCIIVSKKVSESRKADLDAFLDSYKASVDYVLANPDEASETIADLGIVASAAMAKKALPNCNIVYIDGDEMISALSEFYAVLYGANPASVGGKLPDDSLYYKK